MLLTIENDWANLVEKENPQTEIPYGTQVKQCFSSSITLRLLSLCYSCPFINIT